ncbi:hypothetical protein LN650_28220 [Klebsiella pneumoniae subsp. pneumoniae]|nr:hypothetical protein [Klebsiella pneumoniae subsp. pneumoniae]
MTGIRVAALRALPGLHNPRCSGSPAKRSASRGYVPAAAIRALPGLHNPRRSVARLSVENRGCPGGGASRLTRPGARRKSHHAMND